MNNDKLNQVEEVLLSDGQREELEALIRASTTSQNILSRKGKITWSEAFHPGWMVSDHVIFPFLNGQLLEIEMEKEGREVRT